MKKFTPTLLALCAAAFLAAGPARANEPAAGMPDEAAMQAMMKATTPGAQHKVLDAIVGNWDYTITFKMAPDAPEQTSTGTSRNEWILDGRYVQQTVEGTMDMNGKPTPFKGLGFIGHDNVKGKYVSTWMDSMTTGIMISEGTHDAATKSITETGSFYCPMRNKQVTMESVLTLTDADHFTYASYDTTDAGAKFKAMEIKYTRKK
jgi:hypothetical protein